MKRKILLFVSLYLLIFVPQVVSAWKDTGFIQWNQPNGVTFTARLYGDEFENLMVTQGNYQITRGTNGWYYYAQLGANGDFVLSSVRVGIDPPLQTSLNLKRSQARLNEIQNDRNAFNQSLASGSSLLSSTDLSLAIVLVDFTPNIRDDRPHDPGIGYNYQSFHNLFFSNNTYTGTSPDNEPVFGSVRDYYWEQTGNRYNVTGGIINTTNPSNPAKPLWLTLPNSIDYYAANYTKMTILEFLYDQTVSIYPNIANYQYIGFIYGGNLVSSSSNTFWPHSYIARNRNIHIMSEKFGGTFAHIGSHCHELGHSFFSLSDQYYGVDPREYELMSYGTDNGPNRKGECPAPISAIYKHIKGFYGELYNIALGTSNYNIYYGSPTSNKLYKVSIPNSNEYFILECRRRQGFDRYTPDYTYSNELGVYIWHALPSNIFDLVEIEYADNSPSYTENSFPIGNSQDFINFSTPSSRKRNGGYSNVAIKNIQVLGPPNNAYCKVDVLDETPQPPTLTLTGNWGQNPTLSWTNSGETDLHHHVLKIDYVWNAGGTTTRYVDPAPNPYVDQMIFRDKFGDLIAYYHVKAVDNIGSQSVYSNQVSTAGHSNWKNSPSNNTNDEIAEYSLFANYPNPFNPTTRISYSLKEEGLVTLKVYDVLGKEVATLVNEDKPAGFYEVEFDASTLGGLPSGIYFYKMQAGKFTAVNKMMLLR